MNEKELKKYDKHVRQEIYYRSQRPCDGETVLMAFIVKHQNAFPKLVNYPYLLEFEYDVIPRRTDKGRGDLIFTDGKSNYLIVETKFLTEKTGRNPRNANRKRKRKRDVEKQAPKYCSYFSVKYPNTKVTYQIIISKLLQPNIYTKYLKFRTKLKHKWLEREKIVYLENKDKEMDT
ncbi:MAG: hypothetical protein HZR80_05110 [Candidatus Heimdallarchaeota archaeon]